MEAKGLSFRLGALFTAVVFLASSCGGGGQDSAGSPFADPGGSPRGGGAGLSVEVAQLRSETPPLLASAEFGTIPGGASVDGRGNARYSMTIDVPPGPNGQQPALSVSYSSGSRNGKLGLGFNLGGVPTLGRCSHTIADDGATGEIQFDDDDALCFNGQRLVLVEGAYGQQGSEYRTVRDPRSKIVLDVGTIQDRTSEWLVYEPSGRMLRFGGRPDFGPQDLHVSVDDTGVPLTWLLSNTSDRFENEVRYAWHVDSVSEGTRDYRLDEIAYGTASVAFQYETRVSDEMHGFTAGVPYARTDRLAGIFVNGLNGDLLHSYNLDYDTHPNTQHSVLSSIQKCDGNLIDPACLPATTFEWSDVNIDMGFTGCDPISEDAFDENGEFQELTDDDLALIAPGASVMLDAFGDLDHELLLWDAEDDTANPRLWGQTVPGAPSGIDWSLYQTSGTPPTSWLPTRGTADDPEIYAPGWSPSATRIYGQDSSDVLFPLYRNEAGLSPVSSGDPSLDYWGVPFATEFFVLSNPVYNTGSGLIDYASTDLDDGEGAYGGKIYSAVPLDHNGDGLTDLWLCRGDGFKTGRWTLGLNEGLGTPPFSFEWTTTGVQCSVHDELLTVSLHGDARTSLLTVPAYDSSLTADDFDPDYGDYLSHPELQPISDDQRDEYFAVDVESDSLVGTGLPRAYFQSWHDRRCHNGVADAEVGMPVYSAGMGADRIVDINDDGYSDILRAELASGDSYSNIAAIKEGLDATQFPGSPDNPFLCTPDINQDLVVRAYINNGHGFEPGGVLHTFPGRAHANYWINWRGAVPFDHNSDGFTDFLLPGLGTGSDDDALMVSEADGDYFVGGDPVLPAHFPGYGAAQSNGWEVLFDTPSRAFPVDDGQHVWFIGLGEPHPSGICANGSIAQRASISGAHGRVTLESITNGLGATERFRYGLGPQGEVTAPRPEGRIRKRDTVVAELQVQVGPGPDGSEPPTRSTFYEYEAPHYDDHGRALVGYGLVRETTETHVSTRHYNFAYHVPTADYPYAGRPERVETISYNEMEHGVDQRVVSCEDVDDVSTPEPFDGWAMVRPYQEQTWFAYAANTHSYTYTVTDADHTSEAGCDDAEFLVQEATTQTQMNEWGLMTSRVFTVGSDITTTTLSEWVVDEDEWFIRPQRTETQSCVDGVCETRTTRRLYDPATHALEHAYREPDATDSTYLHTSFGYNTRGNLTEVTVEGYGGADPRTSTTTWHPDGVVAESATNAEGHVSYVVTDPRSGVPWASVDPNGVTHKTTFDTFFRPVSARRSDSPSSAVSDGADQTTVFGPGDPELGAAFEVSERVLGQDTRSQIGPTGKVLQVTFKGVTPSDVFPVPEQGPPAGDVYYRNEYDNLGRLARTSHNTFVGDTPDYWTAIEYDDSFRRRRAVVEDASGVELPETEQRWDVTVSAGWEGQLYPKESFFTDEEQNQQSTITDHKGRVLVSRDAAGVATCFDYGPFGRLDAVRRNCAIGASGPQPSATYTYDRLGRSLTETDPAFGTRTMSYTAFGEVESRLDAKGQVTFFQYDDLGRTVREVAPEGQSDWTYDSSTLGALSGSNGPDGVERLYRYDSFGRLGRAITNLPTFGQQTTGDTITVDYSYDVGNRVASVEFEPGIGVTYAYDNVGYHRSTHLDTPAGQELVWAWEHSDENLSLHIQSHGASAVPEQRARTTRYYDAATGRLESSTTAVQGSSVQEFSFGWTPAGDLDYRLDSINGQAEEFEHDALHRLVESRVDGVVRDYAYDVLGNFTQKDGVGTYHYDTDGTRLLYTTNGSISTTYAHDANGAVERFGNTDISWTSFGKAREITQSGSTRRMHYDADGARVLRDAGKGGFTVTAHGLYERRYGSRGNLEEARIRATNAAGAVVGEFRFDHDAQSQTWTRTETRYVHDDHLGSAGLVTDENANELDRVAYDPWGRARDASDWNVYLADSATDDVPVGFTGHQAELDGGLINMRGRMYDPRLGRFMSVDPIIENAINAQTWNSYSYVQNRPLTAVDPTGLGANDDGGAAPEPSVGDNVDCGRDDSSDTGCQRDLLIDLETGQYVGESDGPLSGGGGPVGGAYWGTGGGSGVGMRGSTYLDQLDHLQQLAANQHAHEEASYNKALGCNGGRCAVPRVGEEDLQRAMAGAFSEYLDWMAGSEAGAQGVAVPNPMTPFTTLAWLIPGAVDAESEAYENGELFGIIASAVVGGAELGFAGARASGWLLGRSAAKEVVCFAAGTLVAAKGGLVPIEDVAVGDLVWSRDEETGEEGWKRVREVFVTPDQPLIEVVVGSREGQVEAFAVTAEHPFWSLDDAAWEGAGDLVLGERIDTLSGPLEVLGVARGGVSETVYNFEVEDSHTYFVGESGAWVHNACLAERVRQIHGVLDDIAGRQRTTAILRTNIGDYVAAGARDLNPAQRALLRPGEIAAKSAGTHAEGTAILAASADGAVPIELAITGGPGRFCSRCAAFLEAVGFEITSPTTARYIGG